MDVLKREISRISNQVRRVLHRLEDSLGLADKNSLLLQQNSLSVMEEIDDIYRYDLFLNILGHSPSNTFCHECVKI